MTIKELRDNIDKIDDDNLERLLQDMYDIAYSDGYEDFANKSHFEEMIEKIANLLGVKLYEEFTIRPTERGKILGHKCDENLVYRFDTELVYKGYNDGWSEWYGNGSKTFYYLCLE